MGTEFFHISLVGFKQGHTTTSFGIRLLCELYWLRIQATFNRTSIGGETGREQNGTVLDLYIIYPMELFETSRGFSFNFNINWYIIYL